MGSHQLDWDDLKVGFQRAVIQVEGMCSTERSSTRGGERYCREKGKTTCLIVGHPVSCSQHSPYHEPASTVPVLAHPITQSVVRSRCSQDPIDISKVNERHLDGPNGLVVTALPFSSSGEISPPLVKSVCLQLSLRDWRRGGRALVRLINLSASRAGRGSGKGKRVWSE